MAVEISPRCSSRPETPKKKTRKQHPAHVPFLAKSFSVIFFFHLYQLCSLNFGNISKAPNKTLNKGKSRTTEGYKTNLPDKFYKMNES